MAKGKTVYAALVAAIVMVSTSMPLGAQAPDTVEDLYKVESGRFDEVFLLPEADFRPYTKVMIDQPEVAFARNWLRDYNRSRSSVSDRLSDRDAERILSTSREGLAEVYAGAFGRAGYEVVASPGPDVVRVKVEIVNLMISAPDVNRAARSSSYAREAGQARLVVEVRDSSSGALLGRAVDARRIGDRGMLTLRTTVSNQADFQRAFRRWAELSVAGLEALKEISPLRSRGGS